MRRRHALTDEQWERVRDHVPGKAGDPGRTAADNRLFIDAVLYVLNTGIPWADLPERFGKPNSVWKRYGRWCASGLWPRIAAALCGTGLLDKDDCDEAQLDSTSVKAHPTASTGRRLAGEKKGTPTHAVASADRGAG
jgi:putative transposase